MDAAIITIGDEILNGTTIDTNSTFIGKELALIGISLREKITISDNRQHILNTLENYIGKFPLILITGGLGPTKDDITKHTLADYFNSELILNAEVLEFIEKRFTKRGLTLTELNKLQAMVPAACTVVKNNMGTAPGMWFEKDNSIIISMPGVPYEMQAMVKDSVIPLLQSRFELPAIYNIHIMTSGIGESWLADKISDIEDSLPDSIGLAYLPSPGIVKLRLTARGKNYDALQKNIQPFVDAIVKRLGNKVFSISAETMEEKIGSLLNKLSATLGTVESCTGGSIARKIISVPGSSDYYLGSIVAYHNDLKTTILGVSQTTLNEYGAVSEEAIREMLEGGLQTLKCNYIIATSGIAGPGGGTADKPVGTVFIGIAGKGDIFIKKFLFANDRPVNIEYTCMFALHELRMMLQKHLEKQA